MLKFAVYDHDQKQSAQPAAAFPLYHAHLLGNDSIGMQAEIEFSNGIIQCDKKSIDAAGLELLINVDELGSLVLRTCLLPDREEPYLLHLELARHRVKSFLVKLEDWMLCGIDEQHPVMQAWAEAKNLLSQALQVECNKPMEADRLGRNALKKAIVATEQLTEMHADLLLAKRYRRGPMSNTSFGCRVHQSKFAPPLATTLSQNFDFLSIPIRWRELEPEEGRYDWSKYDKWLEWAARQGYPVVLGPMIDFRPLAVPEWLYVWEHDYDTTLDLLHDHIEAIVRRYRKIVKIWNVASALHINENFTLAYDQLIDVTRMATTLVKSLHPTGSTMIEIADPFGEYYSFNPKSIPPVVYAETIAQAGFKLDMIGINLQMGHQSAGRGTRDLMQISSILDELLFLDMPIVVSGLAVPSHRANRDGLDPAGYWHEPWNPAVQSQFLQKAAAVCLSKPFVQSVCIQELYDHAAGEIPGSGLITATGRGKPALTHMGETHRAIHASTLRCTTAEERTWSETEYEEEADFAG